MGKFERACFRRPVFSPRPPAFLSGSDVVESDVRSDISSLPELIRFNALENPHHTFALQAEPNATGHAGKDDYSYGVSEITFEQLDEMVRGCATWVRKVVVPTNQDTELGQQRPVAIYVENSVGLFIHLAALLSMEIPVLLISARLSSPSVLHLLKKTDAEAILVSQRTRPSLSEYIDRLAHVVQVEPYSSFMTHSSRTHENGKPAKDEPRPQHNGQQTALILHSSGTTGLPKPIFLTHRYLLGYAACHQFAHDEEPDWVNLSTLPMYHGFGLLAPCLSLSVGMTVCFPPPSIIPATRSTLDLIRDFNCRSLMTVPSIIDDILCQPDENERNEALRLLAKLEFLAVGGGALKPEHGALLAKHNIKLLNHYGVTEIGAIAPIFRPGSDYNWRFLRLRSDLGLELHPIPDSKYFRLVGHPIGWGKPFEVQDELERNEASSHVEVRILGRTDDVIVLKTGEKIQPRNLEDALNADSAIRTAVCVGSGFFELAVIIDPIHENNDDEATKDQVWKLLSAINASVDHHARITSKKAIIIKPKEKPIPRSDKGSIMRQQVHEIFEEEIRDAYTAMEFESFGEGFSLNPANMEMGIRHLLTVVTSNRLDGNQMDPEQDFFEGGMDSLQTVQLSRFLRSGLRKLKGGETLQISADFIYRNPSIKRLAAESMQLINQKGEIGVGKDDDRTKQMSALVGELLASSGRQIATAPIKHTILMTGSTGNLGAHTLAKLTQSKTVSKVICLVRGQPPVTGDTNSILSNGEKAQSVLLDRQQSALEAAGIRLGPKEWAKIELLELASITGENETSEAQLSNLSGRITHIFHLAWPMDFQRTLDSFRPHTKLLETLVKLAEQSTMVRKLKEPIRLLFSSSIAVARYYGEKGGKRSNGHSGSIVPESAIQDPLVSMPMGYAEAKWVCETYLNDVAKLSSAVDPVVVRVGQLSGPERTSGIWKTEEHIPTLVRASQKIGAFPDLKGMASWIPVDRAASSLSEILLYRGKINSFLHLENPIRQPLKDIFTIMAHELHLEQPFMIPFEQWLQRATTAGEIRSLESFYAVHFHDLAGGAVTLDTANAPLTMLLSSADTQSRSIWEIDPSTMPCVDLTLEMPTITTPATTSSCHIHTKPIVRLPPNAAKLSRDILFASTQEPVVAVSYPSDTVRSSATEGTEIHNNNTNAEYQPVQFEHSLSSTATTKAAQNCLNSVAQVAKVIDSQQHNIDDDLKHRLANLGLETTKNFTWSDDPDLPSIPGAETKLKDDAIKQPTQKSTKGLMSSRWATQEEPSPIYVAKSGPKRHIPQKHVDKPPKGLANSRWATREDTLPVPTTRRKVEKETPKPQNARSFNGLSKSRWAPKDQPQADRQVLGNKFKRELAQHGLRSPQPPTNGSQSSRPRYQQGVELPNNAPQPNMSNNGYQWNNKPPRTSDQGRRQARPQDESPYGIPRLLVDMEEFRREVKEYGLKTLKDSRWAN
ncbi:hypothetical protein O1611_g272 [Lasiodiplodia mahajangana]|uniref:Uncharacterized protein n=1 Tax=Lasiodiplodia mahajangana TaxID=1108764 RepID=A0ACC2K0Z6_9PEZI|nr:hypothetical protein O1611_g272 [Lasiodiplodia mahajangana]